MTISRRGFIAALPLIACATDADARAPRFHIAPDGDGDGSSWAAAAPLPALDELISQTAADGEILIAADRGEYILSGELRLSHGGVKGHPVRIRGVASESGAPMPAVLRGDRGGGEIGASAFRLFRGASDLFFSHFEFRAVGNGCFSVAGPLSGLVIEDCRFDDVYRFLENTAADDAGHATLRDFALRRCHGAGAERGFLRIRYNSGNGAIEDCSAQGLANEGGYIPAGCALDDRANAITYRRCVMANFQQWRAGDYWNGDGFSDEAGNRNIRYEACEARGSTDGGFDCKSRDVVLESCIAEDNKRNFRIWSERATLANCTSRRPNFRGRDVEDADPCHLWIGNEGRGRVLVSDLTVEDDCATPILE
ncbi:MAG: hypothetical protein R3C25_11100, partial [Hyphomonadaceae bacterium]